MMSPSARALFAALAAIALVLAGCGGGPTRPDTPERFDPTKPNLYFAGADVETVRSVAMGKAVTQGWQIVDANDERFVVRRPLAAAAAESVVPGSSLSPRPPVIEVQTDLVPQPHGVIVAVAANVVVDPGSEAETRIDYSDTYRADLMRSLARLRRDWAETRGRIAAAIPDLPAPQPTENSLAEWLATPNASEVDGLATEPEPVPVVEPSEQPVTPTDTLAVAPPPSEPEPSVPPTAAAPRADILPTAPPATASPDLPNRDVLVLDPTPTGVWAYYAEHYAQVRGCNLAGKGAVLIDKTERAEIHRVYCEGGRSLLVKCNLGTCRSLE